VNFCGSYAIFPKREKLYTNLQPLNVQSLDDIDSISNAIGYISYEYYQEIENIIPPKTKPLYNFPLMHFSSFEESQKFDIAKYNPQLLPKIKWIKSNFTKQEYFNSVEKILQYIKKGTCYQVNLTRKFYGEFETRANPVDIFAKLYSISPNPYSMLYVLDEDRAIISSSPECFLTRSGGEIYSVPIKGSLNATSLIEDLQNIKDKSENLMITDLVRNDIGRISSKVWVENFQETQTFTQVHHMSSKVLGMLHNGITNSQCLKATFPAGSMTGTPKIKAIEIANELETIQRGVYSGCLGIIDDKSNFDLSVVIRSIILDGKNFEFQVGGAVVFDSTSQAEFDETITKAQPILKTLGVDENIF
jgi:para-aminobenzoate synthetase component 1